MYGLKVKKENAELVRDKLIQDSVLDLNHKVKRLEKHIIFPITNMVEYENAVYIEAEFESYPKQETDMKEILKKRFSSNELKKLKTSYDVIGTIAIIKIPEELQNKKNSIGKAVLKTSPGVKTVLEKADKIDGIHRVPTLAYVCGEKTFETTHIEYGVKVTLDVSEVYFSPRLGNERKRVAELVKPNDNVCVMFSGCGVYNLMIGKYSKANSIIGIEINPSGHKYAQINKKLNKQTDLKFYLGDVIDVMPSFEKRFDKIVMPLPKNSEDYLPLAINSACDGATIYLYKFLDEEEVEEFTNQLLKMNNVKEIENVEICGDHSPGVHRYCFDIQIQ